MILNYIKKRMSGYYVYAGAAILSLVAAITYIVGFTSESMSKYMCFAVFLLSLVAFISVAALSVIDVTMPFAPLVGGLLTLASQCVCIRTVYMYFTEVFYNGVSLEAIAQIDKSFLWFIILTVVATIAYVVSCFMTKTKTDEEGTER